MKTLFTVILLLFCSLCNATIKYVYNVTKDEVVEEYNAYGTITHYGRPFQRGDWLD